jgi:putative CocE/NonD family hydrolase
MLSWFDRYLMRLSDVPQPGAKVTSWQLPHYSGHWTELSDWPTRTRRIDWTGPWGTDTTEIYPHTVVPYDNGCACMEHGAYNSADLPLNDQRMADLQRVKWDTGPLPHDMVIVGTPVMNLSAALSAPDGNIVVRLEDLAPNGTSYVITTGWLRASHRLGHQHSVVLEPNRPYNFTIPLWPTDWNIKAGHYLRITISSGDLQMIEPDGKSGNTMMVYAGKYGSSIDIPFQD